MASLVPAFNGMNKGGDTESVFGSKDLLYESWSGLY